MEPEKTVYYTDPLNDDFAGTGIKTKKVDGGFPYEHRSRLWNIAAYALYYIVAVPLVYIASKLYLGLRFENRSVLKKVRKTGYYLYGNHTRDLDAFVPAMAAFPKKAYIITNPDAVSLPFLYNVVQMLGAIPIPTELSGMRPFMAAVFRRIEQKKCVTIYPEAHVWPFYTGIRPFVSTSFHYPVKDGAPVVAMVTKYRKRKGLFFLAKKPGMTVTFSEPMYADSSLTPKNAQEELRGRVYDFMKKTSSSGENIEYIRYIRKNDTDTDDSVSEND